MKLDESRGFDLTINVPHQTCTCADLLALGRATACETVKGWMTYRC